jgi:hypothetical protein
VGRHFSYEPSETRISGHACDWADEPALRRIAGRFLAMHNASAIYFCDGQTQKNSAVERVSARSPKADLAGHSLRPKLSASSGSMDVDHLTIGYEFTP